jgi:hypothetical protein
MVEKVKILSKPELPSAIRNLDVSHAGKLKLMELKKNKNESIYWTNKEVAYTGEN